jgi:type IV secretion system protein VirB1
MSPVSLKSKLLRFNRYYHYEPQAWRYPRGMERLSWTSDELGPAPSTGRSRSTRRAISSCRNFRLWTAAGVLLTIGAWVPARAEPLALAQLAAMARTCAPHVAVSTLAAIARTESNVDPLALRDNTAGVGSAPAQLADAVTIAGHLIAAGHSVDLGLMQINSANLPSLGLTVTQAFDPCRSLEAAATILSGDYGEGATHAQQQAALQVAISRYNTGDPARGFANGYVGKVEAANAIIVPALDAPSPAIPLDRSATFAEAAAPSSWDVFSFGSGDSGAVMFFPRNQETR